MSQQTIDFATVATPRVVLSARTTPAAGPEPIRVVVAGNQLISREGLHAIIACNEGFRVVGEAEDGKAGLDVASSKHADVLVVDMPPVCEFDLHFLTRIAAESMPIRALLLLSPLLPAEALRAINLGAHGVLSKDFTSSQDLHKALLSVSAGRYWMGESYAPTLAQARESVSDGGDADTNCQRFGLTRRELQIVPLMVQGYSNRDIANTLSISIQTVKHHCSHIYDKIGSSNRLELALFAVHHRLVSQTDPPRTSRRDNSPHAR